MRLSAFALLFALAACGDDEAVEDEGDDSRIASGEVLEGTISDEMIPLDQLRSQAPPLRVAPTGNGAENGAASEEVSSPDEATQDDGATDTAPLIPAEPVLPAPPAAAE